MTKGEGYNIDQLVNRKLFFPHYCCHCTNLPVDLMLQTSLQAVSASSRHGSGSSFPRGFSLSSYLPLSLVCMLSCLYLCECCCPLMRWCGLSSFQVSMVERRWCGPGPTYSLKLLSVLLDPPSSLLFYSLHFCHQLVYTVILLLIYSVHSTSIACLSVLGEGSLLCCSS